MKVFALVVNIFFCRAALFEAAPTVVNVLISLTFSAGRRTIAKRWQAWQGLCEKDVTLSQPLR
jgi:hypothetical protein